MNLGQFHDRVKRALGRGDSLDDDIPSYVEQAVQEIENNYTFQYMKQWVDITVDPDVDSPYIVSLYATPIKRVQLLRYLGDDGKFKDIKGPIDPVERTTRLTGAPTAFWLNGVNSIILDSIPDEELALEAHLYVFTQWQPDQLEAEHYLIDRYRKLLLSETVLQANDDLRDERLAMKYGDMNLRAWTTAKVAEEDMQYGGNTEAKMEYRPSFDEYDTNFDGRD